MLTLANLFLMWQRGSIQRLCNPSLALKALIDSKMHSTVCKRRDVHSSAFMLSDAKPQLLLTTEGYEVLTTPRISISLSSWTSYFRINKESPPCSDLHVLLETHRPEDVDKFVDDVLNISSIQRVELLSLCTPISWSPGEPYRIICSCSVSQCLSLMEAFLHSYLIMNELLQIDLIAVVDVTGSPADLLAPGGLGIEGTPWEEKPRGNDTSWSDDKGDDISHGIDPNGCGPGGHCLEADVFFESATRYPPSNRVTGSCFPTEGSSEHSQRDLRAEDACDSSSVVLSIDSSSSETDVHGKQTPRWKTVPDTQPNILLYTGKKFTAAVVSDLEKLLASCLIADCYAIYHLTHTAVFNSPWHESCRLLVIATEQLFEGVDTKFTEYFYHGGKILSLCSNFDRDFTERLQNPSCNSVTFIRSEIMGISIDLMQGRYHYKSLNSPMPGVKLSLLGSDVNQRFVALEGLCQHGGQSIFTQVHLETGLVETGASKELLEHLSFPHTDETRKSVIRHLLRRLGLEVGSQSQETCLTDCQLVCRNKDLHEIFVKSICSRLGLNLEQNRVAVQGIGDLVLKEFAEFSTSSFNWEVYWKHLSSERLGNTVLYQEICRTTQTLVESFIFSSPPACGLVAVAGQQTAGVGRAGNTWLSPKGSVALTMHVRIPIDSNIGRSPALIQTIPAVAAVKVAYDLCAAGYSAGHGPAIRVKWPNDIYFNSTKIGGVLVKSSILQSTLHAMIGIGLNVMNERPTVNMNDVLDEFSVRTGASVPHTSREEVIGRLCSQTERLIDLLNRSKTEYYEEYYRHWMHTGARVDVPHEGIRAALILGLDEYGYLRLDTGTGETFSVQPDGNSFDIMHNLIKLKEQIA